jgi:hypothetical protein
MNNSSPEMKIINPLFSQKFPIVERLRKRRWNEGFTMRPAIGALLKVIVRVTMFAIVVSAVFPSPVMAKLTGHLYVVVGQSEIKRFPLIDGIPAQRSDLTIPNGGPVLTIQPDGTVVAQIFNLPKIGFYAPGHTKPDRTLNILPPKHGCPVFLMSAAVDASANVYISRQVPYPCNADGIAVYAPKASGNDKPIAVVKAPARYIAVDPVNGELFDSVGLFNQPTTMYAFSNLSSHFRPLNHFVGFAQFSQGITIAIDTTPHILWAYTAPTQWAANSLAGYDPASNGFTIPLTGLFASNSDIALSGAVVYWNGFLYSTFASSAGQGVNGFQIGTNNVATLKLPACCSDHIAAGP